MPPACRRCDFLQLFFLCLHYVSHHRHENREAELKHAPKKKMSHVLQTGLWVSCDITIFHILSILCHHEIYLLIYGLFPPNPQTFQHFPPSPKLFNIFHWTPNSVNLTVIFNGIIWKIMKYLKYPLSWIRKELNEIKY